MKNIRLVLILLSFLLIPLSACAGETRPQTESTEYGNRNLQLELEELRAELDALQTELETARIEPQEDEEDTHTLPDDSREEPQQAEEAELQIDFPQFTLAEILVDGNWFSQGEYDMFIEYRFNDDGTGLEIEWFHGEQNGMGVNLTWSVEDDNVHMLVQERMWWLDNDYTERFFTFDDGLLIDTPSGTIFAGVRPPKPPFIAEGLDLARREELLKQRFLGEWYFDIVTWTFNADGTGVINVPAFGMHPADQIEFTFTVFESEVTDAMLMLDSPQLWRGRTAFPHATFGTRAGGSVTFSGGPPDAPPIVLTRLFDFSNTPLMDGIVADGLALLDLISNFIP